MRNIRPIKRGRLVDKKPLLVYGNGKKKFTAAKKFGNHVRVNRAL